LDIETRENSREIAFLDDMKEWALRWILRGATAAAIGAILLAAHLLGHLGVVFGFVGVLGGPFFVVVGLLWLRLLPAARKALEEVPLEARIEVGILKGGYGFSRSTMARLWSPGPDSYWLAKFSETMHWQTPRLLTVNRVPAQVYGAPTRGAAVVVTCSEGVVVGRIRGSRFGKPPPAPKPMSPLRASLQKPRSLRIR
jgi:hypothetical protein